MGKVLITEGNSFDVVKCFKRNDYELLVKFLTQMDPGLYAGMKLARSFTESYLSCFEGKNGRTYQVRINYEEETGVIIEVSTTKRNWFHKEWFPAKYFGECVHLFLAKEFGEVYIQHYIKTMNNYEEKIMKEAESKVDANKSLANDMISKMRNVQQLDSYFKNHGL